jgi:hypothetical protein
MNEKGQGKQQGFVERVRKSERIKADLSSNLPHNLGAYGIWGGSLYFYMKYVFNRHRSYSRAIIFAMFSLLAASAYSTMLFSSKASAVYLNYYDESKIQSALQKFSINEEDIPKI